MVLPSHIKKRDGLIDLFEPIKIKEAINSAVTEVRSENILGITETIFNTVVKKLNEKQVKYIPEINELQNIIINCARDAGYADVSKAYRDYSKERAETRKVLAIAFNSADQNTTDASLLIASDTQDSLSSWDRSKIVAQLVSEAKLSQRYAEKIAKKVENAVVGLYKKAGIRKFHTQDIRALVDLILKEEGLENQSKKQALLGLPSSDFLKIVFSRSNENSNIAANNPEAVNLEVAERIQKNWALANIFSEDVSDAHLKGKVHVHDLGYPTRAYCSSHSLEYIKKYGLNKILGNLESKSASPNSAAVLNQHVQTFLASMQAHYAGALGFGFLNILYAPLLNRPVKVVYGKLKNSNKLISFEKKDFEKLIEQKTFSLNKQDENYFDIVAEKKEFREVSQDEFNQVAQNLIFASSQNAFSRGGQTLFIDFNLHTGVPNYMKNVPAIGPRGKYMIMKKDNEVVFVDNVPRIKTKNPQDANNGDAFDEGLKDEFEGGHIIVYGDLESTAQKFAKAMLAVWMKGDKDGRPFHFPKCDLHVDANSFKYPKQKEVLDLAVEVAQKNGCTYFMFDRGNGAVLAQCCRLKEKIEDTSMLKFPEKLRFCGFQNVTVNLAQAAYEGKTFDGTCERIEEAMEIALKAHTQKAKFMQKLLDTDGSPMRTLGKIGEDGEPYIDLKKSTYIIGNIGLNEAVEVLTGKEMHESEEAYGVGLKIIAFMYKKIQEFKKRTGLKFTIEETPAESTTRRLAKVDKKRYELARKVVKGTEENPYYTNSIHFAPGADIGIVERIVGQSKFHDMIESGAIVHAYIGEQRPNKEVIEHLVKKTLEDTRCSQLVFSPTYTECDECGNVMNGERELCSNGNCKNSNPKTLNKENLAVVTKVVGYNSRVNHWNSSQQQIYEDRKKAELFYAGKSGRDMSWLHRPSLEQPLEIIIFGKHDCPYCDKLKVDVKKELDNLKLNLNYKFYYLDENNNEGLVKSAKYSVPLDSVPTIVIANKTSFWKKTTEYGTKSSCTDGVCSVGIGFGKENLIKPEEIRKAIEERIYENEGIEVLNFEV